MGRIKVQETEARMMDGWSIAQNCKTSLLNHWLLLSQVSVILSGSHMGFLPLKEIDRLKVDKR